MASGQSKLKYPVLMKWISTPKVSAESADFYFTPVVSAKKIKRAVDRNLIKRRLKEVVRKNPPHILASEDFKGNKLEIVYLFLAKEVEGYHKISAAVKKLHAQLKPDKNPHREANSEK